MIKSYRTLEFDKVLNKLSEYAVSQTAKEKLLALTPSLNERECNSNMRNTSDGKKVLESIGTPPLAAMDDLDKTLALAEKGAMLTPEQLSSVSNFIYSCRRMVTFLKKAESLQVNLAYYSMSFLDLDEVYEEINRSIRSDKVDDAATKTLQDIRRKLENTRSSVKVKLEAVLRSKRAYLSDNMIVNRDGRFALPVKREHKGQVPGSVLDTSSSGSTLFIEPSAIGKLQEQLNSLLIDEDSEIRKILYTLSALVADNMTAFATNIGYMETLDFIFAKAKFSYELKASAAEITTDRVIKIVRGRHPLLNRDECIPLDFELGTDYRGIVITGPNTGGKTVALKTVGLLSLMAQCGLHVPAEPGSTFSMHADYLCDIGDGQSISENLSTFSAHITNIVGILETVSDESLVLLDELGSGTDPAEGMGIAVAILDELRKKNCLFLATTHYPEIKDFAKHTPALINARMGFDRENLKPLYKLQIGEAGESCALSIAERLGLPKHLLERARKEAYHDKPSNPQPERFRTPIIDDTVVEDTQEHPRSNRKTSSKIIKDIPALKNEIKSMYEMGDSVTIFPEEVVGIVYQPADDCGDLIIQIKGEKRRINHTRVKLKLKASELYPPDYDFSIIFDSVENRKARHKMGKGHRPDLVIKFDDL